MTLTAWINLWLRGWILSTSGKYIMYWKPNQTHSCPIVYAGSRVAWLVSHGGRRSLGYRCLVPWLRVASVLQCVVLIAGSFSAIHGVILPVAFVLLPMKPFFQSLCSLVTASVSFLPLHGSSLCEVLRVVGFPTTSSIGDSACKTVRCSLSDR